MTPIEKVLTIRHGESGEDINPNVREKADDEQIPLTETGIKQAKQLAKTMREELVEYEKITLFISPSRRAQETAEIVTEELDDSRIEVITEESIRNLNWGDTTESNVKEIEQERYDAGVLYYKFPNGDYTPQYVDEIYKFIYGIITDRYYRPEKECIIIICHGFSLRIIVKAFTEMDDNDFKWIKNPPNAFIARIYFDPENKTFYTPEPLPKRGKIDE